MAGITASEKTVVGGVCIEPTCIREISAFLSPEDFSIETCGEVYRLALEDPHFDAAVASNALAATLGEDRARHFIVDCMDACPSVRTVPYHARNVHSAARLRRLHDEIGEAMLNTEDAGALAEQLAGLSHKYLAEDNGREYTLTLAMMDVMREFDHWQDKRLDTGFQRLDKLLKGLYPGQLILIGARPSVGKSAFALNLALNVARVGKVVFFSQEMTGVEIAQRSIVTRSSIPLDFFLDGKIDEKNMSRVADAAGELSRLHPIVIDDRSSLSLEQLRARVRLHPDARLVIVDYLGLMKSTRKDGNRNLELGELARGLKNFSGEMGIPIIALSQLNRGTDDTERPSLRALRDSGELEQHASKVLMIWKSTDELIAVDVAKNRNGRTGIVQFEFDRPHMRFIESPLKYEPPAKSNRRGFM